MFSTGGSLAKSFDQVLGSKLSQLSYFNSFLHLSFFETIGFLKLFSPKFTTLCVRFQSWMGRICLWNSLPQLQRFRPKNLCSLQRFQWQKSSRMVTASTTACLELELTFLSKRCEDWSINTWPTTASTPWSTSWYNPSVKSPLFLMDPTLILNSSKQSRSVTVCEKVQPPALIRKYESSIDRSCSIRCFAINSVWKYSPKNWIWFVHRR